MWSYVCNEAWFPLEKNKDELQQNISPLPVGIHTLY